VAADQHRLAGFDPYDGDEKNAQVVIHPLEMGLIQAAPWAAPGRFIQYFDPGLDAADEQKEAGHHGCTPGSAAAAVG
jgi:hypothetical protein